MGKRASGKDGERRTTDRSAPRTHRIVHLDGSIEYVSLAESDELVDASSADSFPASDPPSFTPISHTGGPRLDRKP